MGYMPGCISPVLMAPYPTTEDRRASNAFRLAIWQHALHSTRRLSRSVTIAGRARRARYPPFGMPETMTVGLAAAVQNRLFWRAPVRVRLLSAGFPRRDGKQASWDGQ